MMDPDRLEEPEPIAFVEPHDGEAGERAVGRHREQLGVHLHVESRMRRQDDSPSHQTAVVVPDADDSGKILVASGVEDA